MRHSGALLVGAMGVLASVGHAAASTASEASVVTPVAEPLTSDVLLESAFSWARHAEQDDVFGPLTAFGLEPPKGVPTPRNSVVTSMTVQMLGASPMWFAATASFVSETPLQEGMPSFEAAMADRGFALVQRGDVFEQGEFVSQSLHFGVANAVHSEVALSADFTHVAPGHELVEIEYSGQFEPDVAGLSAWFVDLPLVDEATALVRWTFAAGADPDDLDIEVGADLKFEITGLDLAERFPAALAVSPYTVDPNAATSPNDYILVGSDFDRLEVDVHPVAGAGRLEVFATIDLPG